MTRRSRIVLVVHRLLVRTSQTPLARLWGLAYMAFARLVIAYLVRGEDEPAAYLRGSLKTGDFLAGLSDVDLAIVLARDPAGPGLARKRVSERWLRLRRAVPSTDLVLDYPRVHEEVELADLNGGSALTYGLDGRGEPRAGYSGPAASPDRTRMLERPGLYDGTAAWNLVSGPDRRPPEAARDPQRRRIAAWLELLHWWQWVFPVCVDPGRPRTAHLCVKLVAEPARVWLWLAHGERAPGRDDALHRAMRRLPTEESALRRALALERSLPDSPAPPLNEVLPVLVRLTARIAELIATQVEDEGTSDVRLAGAEPAEVIRADGRWRAIPSLPGGDDPRRLPLCDWRNLAVPDRPDRTLALLGGDPADPAVLAAAALSQQPGPQPALDAGHFMVLPDAAPSRIRLRAIQCPQTDPVSFALAAGRRTAKFPNVPGWSAQDTARRAVAEHRARLEMNPPTAATPQGGGETLALLLTAARAALFWESIREGEPLLPVTVTETVRQLAVRSSASRAAAEDALQQYRAFAGHLTPPPAATVAALRSVVLELPAYARAE